METFICVIEAGSRSAGVRWMNVGQPASSKTTVHVE
jgi:hypothetical protein